MQFKLLYSIAAFFLAIPCFAEDSPYSIIKHLDFIYFGIFDGPTVFNPTRYLPDRSGNENLNRPVSLTSYITTGYRLTPDLTLGVLNTFEFFPFSENGFHTLDPAFSLTHHGLFKSNNFSTLFDLRVYLPLTEASRTARMSTVIQSFQITEYRFSQSKWALGSMSMIKVGFFGESEEE